MMTICERCCTGIEDDEVEHCKICDADGLCRDCLIDHEDADGNPCDNVSLTIEGE